MKERAEKRGFRVVAMGAFVAQHTMASEVGTGRPDVEDEAIMVDFGRKAYEKVLSTILWNSGGNTKSTA